MGKIKFKSSAHLKKPVREGEPAVDAAIVDDVAIATID